MDVENGVPAVEKTSNHSDTSGFEYSLRYTKWLLTVLGIWPYIASNPTKIERYVSKFHFPLSSIFMFVILPLPTALHAVSEDLDTLESLMLIGPAIFQAFNVLKHLLLFVRSASIKLCIEHMEDDWRNIENHNDRSIMMKNLKIGKDVITVCMMSVYGCGITLWVPFAAIFYSGKTIDELNETMRRLPYPGLDRFLDFQSALNYEIALWSFGISMFFLCTVVITVCNLIALFVTHTCGQIQIVTSQIETLIRSDDVTNDNVKHRINFIIEFHVRVLRFTSIVEKVVQEMCLLEVGASVILMCIYEYSLIAVVKLNETFDRSIMNDYRHSKSQILQYWRDNNPVEALVYFFFCVTLSLNIYIYCFFGELLMNQCQEIGKTAYMTDWYKLPGTTALSLVLIIGMTNSPRKLTACGVIDLSICSWGNILKTSFTYLNLLATMTE